MYINISYIHMCRLNKNREWRKEWETVVSGDDVCDCSFGELLDNTKPFWPLYIFKLCSTTVFTTYSGVQCDFHMIWYSWSLRVAPRVLANNDLQNTTQITKDWALKTRGHFTCSGRVSSSWPYGRIFRVCDLFIENVLKCVSLILLVCRFNLSCQNMKNKFLNLYKTVCIAS